MKIVYLSTSTIISRRANSVHVMKMCAALGKVMNFPVELWCLGNRKENSCEYSFYGVEKSFSLVKMFKPAFFSFVKDFIYLSLISGIKLLIHREDALCIGRAKLAFFIIKGRYNYLVETHTPPKNRLLYLLEKSILEHKNNKGIIVISNALKSEYLRLFPEIPESKYIVLHDGADLKKEYEDEDSAPRVQKGESSPSSAKEPSDAGNTPALKGKGSSGASVLQSSRGLNVGYVGQLYPGKCMELLIPIAQLCPEFSFHIVGGDEKDIERWREVISSKAVENIYFYGFVEHKKVYEYYSAFDCVIMPFSEKVYVDNRTEIGSFFSPLKLFEAMSCERCIVASNLPTIREIITSGKEGFLCPPYEEEAAKWAEVLQGIYTDPAAAKQIAVAALNKLKANYTWEKRAQAYKEVIERIAIL